MALASANVRSRLRTITSISFFISGIVTGTWASRIPEMQQKFQLNDARWGAVLFAIPVGLFIGLPISSWLVARFSSYKTMAVSGIVYALLLCMLPFAPNVYVMAALLFLFGVSRNFYNITINTNSVEVQRFYKMPIIATFHGIWSFACLVAAGIGTVIIWAQIAPEYHFIFIAISLAIVIFLTRIKRKKRVAPPAGSKPLFVMPDRYLALLGIMCFCAMTCEGVMMDWSVNYFDRVVKADRNLVTAGYTSFIITMTLGRFIGDKLIAYFGALVMLIISGVLLAAGFAIAVLFPFVYAVCFGFLLVGFGDSILVPLIFSMAGKSTRMAPSFAIASVTMIGYTGFLSAPLIIGTLSKAYGMQWAFSLMIVFAIVISATAFYILKNRQLAK